jgi:hypothetical protein
MPRARHCWESVDSYRKTVEQVIVWFGVRVPPTAYVVAKVEITLTSRPGQAGRKSMRFNSSVQGSELGPLRLILNYAGESR